MPTYAYRCPSCAYEFEAVQKMSEDPLRFCPECGSPIKRVIFPAGIVFKGSGFYINDSRKGSSDSEGSSSTATSTETSSAKTDAAPTTSPSTSTSTTTKAAD